MTAESRRKFLKTMSLSAAVGSGWLHAPPLMGRRGTSSSKVLGANDRIQVALIGCGGMGRGDLRDFLRVKNVECVALCDVDDAQSSKALKDIETQGSERPKLITREIVNLIQLWIISFGWGQRPSGLLIRTAFTLFFAGIIRAG